jgi:hypothetical protein
MPSIDRPVLRRRAREHRLDGPESPRTNLLPVALPIGEWYQYHHLLRLLRELHRREWLVPELHVRAAQWCEAHRMRLASTTQAGGDVERANRLILVNTQRYTR